MVPGGQKGCQRPEHSTLQHPLQTCGALTVTLSTSRGSHSTQGTTKHWNFPAAPGSFSSALLLKAGSDQNASPRCSLLSSCHSSTAVHFRAWMTLLLYQKCTGSDPSLPTFNAAQGPSFKLPTYCRPQRNVTTQGKTTKIISNVENKPRGPSGFLSIKQVPQAWCHPQMGSFSLHRVTSASESKEQSGPKY